jgi:hypothetical protein
MPKGGLRPKAVTARRRWVQFSARKLKVDLPSDGDEWSIWGHSYLKRSRRDLARDNKPLVKIDAVSM